MQMSVPTLTGMSSMKIIRKIPGMKQSSASIQLFNFTLSLKCSSIIRVTWQRFLHIPKLGISNNIYTSIMYSSYCHSLLSLKESISSWSIILNMHTREILTSLRANEKREVKCAQVRHRKKVWLEISFERVRE